MTIMPVPPLPSRFQRFVNWIKSLYKKEPVGLLALVITILLSVAPLTKDIYYSLYGASYSAIVNFRNPILKHQNHQVSMKIENYSGIPVQGLKATITLLPDSLEFQYEPKEIILGTIPRYSQSSNTELYIVCRKSGNAEMHIKYEPINDQSTINHRTQIIPFTIRE